MRRRDLLRAGLASTVLGAVPGGVAAQVGAAADTKRGFWLGHLDRVAKPLVEALASGRLRSSMPIEAKPGMEASRARTSHLEAFGRLVSGIAPWLELAASAGAEGELRAKYLRLVRGGLTSALDPNSADAFFWDAENQNLVDAAFLALGILRAPRVLNRELDATTKQRLIAAFTKTRRLEAGFNNWLLFAACVEAALHALGAPWDATRVDFAIREHMGWYVGDGTYGDGPHFHWDYYNSFVIHPFLLAVLGEVGEQRPAWKTFAPVAKARAVRYAHVQERMIAGDGSYPVVGRSIAYRCGAFHALADVALRGSLAEDLKPEQVRCGLGAVIAKTLGAKGTYDGKGWLQIGLAGHQPSLGETYISTGSLYLCANAFLPLGLAEGDRFWSGADADWTAKKVWSGVDLANDHAIEG